MKRRRQAVAPVAKACEPPLQGVVLPPFPGIETACPKCGDSDAIAISYFSADGKCGHCVGPTYGFTLNTPHAKVWGQERMHRSCGLCGYMWDHQCADGGDNAR